MRAGDAQRVAREAIEREPLTVEAQLALISDMFDRLERQASELGRVQARADSLASELEREHNARRAAERRLDKQGAELEQLRAAAAEVESEREARHQLVNELADERAVNERLEAHLGAAWQEVHAMRAELMRPWWRRRRRRVESRAWAHSFEARAIQAPPSRA